MWAGSIPYNFKRKLGQTMNLIFDGGVLRISYSNDEEKVDFDNGISYPSISTQLKKKSTRPIPTEICCGGDGNIVEEEYKSQDNHNDAEEDNFECMLRLLESEFYNDNRDGMYQLMQRTNTELVDSSRHNDSIAQNLLLPDVLTTTNNVCKLATAARLRLSFLRFLASDSLRLPTLRVLLSTLELVQKTTGGDSSDKIDYSSQFWREILIIISKNLENKEIHKLEAALSIKCVRLLYTMDPTVIGPYVRYTLLPYILHIAQTQGKRNRLLMKETTRLIQPLGITIELPN